MISYHILEYPRISLVSYDMPRHSGYFHVWLMARVFSCYIYVYICRYICIYIYVYMNSLGVGALLMGAEMLQSFCVTTVCKLLQNTHIVPGWFQVATLTWDATVSVSTYWNRPFVVAFMEGFAAAANPLEKQMLLVMDITFRWGKNDPPNPIAPNAQS